MSEENIRYVITHLNRDGMRTLTFPMQGRYTYATVEEATAALVAYQPQLSIKLYIGGSDSLAVRPVACWPGHNDPKTCWFD